MGLIVLPLLLCWWMIRLYILLGILAWRGIVALWRLGRAVIAARRS